jgi:magnesium-transporting ATPase (P-type)
MTILVQVQHVFTDKTGTLTCNQMKFRLLSVVARSDTGFDAHMYGTTHLHDDLATVSGSAAADAAADAHVSKTAFLNDELDEKREAVFAAVQGGRMVSWAHVSGCVFDFRAMTPYCLCRFAQSTSR